VTGFDAGRLSAGLVGDVRRRLYLHLLRSCCGNWIRGRGFRIIRTWRGSAGARTLKNLQSAWFFIRKFNFLGRVTVYPAGDADLRQFVGVAAEDLAESAVQVPAVADGAPPALAGIM
jgi:hypothetical protein